MATLKQSSKDYYHPPEVKYWQGMLNTPPNSYFFQIIKMFNLSQSIATANEPVKKYKPFAFLGFCCDEGVHRNLGRRGAKQGPNKLREALARTKIPHSHINCYDAGNIFCDDENLEAAQQALANAIEILLSLKMIPIIFGGGHEVAFGVYQGIANTRINEHMAVLNFDAHFDMRPLLRDDKGSSGTPFLQIANLCRRMKLSFDYSVIGIQASSNIPSLFKIAKEHKVNVVTADEIHLGRLDNCFDLILNNIADEKLLYVTLCLDVFAQAFAPGVSAPQTLGLTPRQVIPMLRLLAQSGKIICFDIAELAPKYDIDGRTAQLAATIVYEILNSHLRLLGP